MPTLRVKKYAVRDATDLRRLDHQNYLAEGLAQRAADKLVRKGKPAIVVPVEE